VPDVVTLDPPRMGVAACGEETCFIGIHGCAVGVVGRVMVLGNAHGLGMRRGSAARAAALR
jgi:hypothetical protein